LTTKLTTTKRAYTKKHQKTENKSKPTGTNSSLKTAHGCHVCVYDYAEQFW